MDSIISVRQSVERLMDISTVIGELTSSIRAFERLAPFLAEAFGLDELVVLLLEQKSGGTAQVLMESCCKDDLPRTSGHVCAGCFDLETLLQKEQDVNCLSFWKTEIPGAFDDVSRDCVARIDSGSQLVLSKPVDSTHRLMLAFGHAYGWSERELEIFQMTMTHLAKAVKLMVQWHPSAVELGAPFDRLTEKEWRVLVGLKSDDGEKQLADRLELSPHTLHSHIKAIYRKIGVQGRLPLLRTLQVAMADYRRRNLLAPAQEPAAVLGRTAC